MLIIAAVVALGVQLPGLAGTADAAKPPPPEVSTFSNGFPSGPHLTLNVHGKKADFATSGTCTDGLPGGGSIFIPIGTPSDPEESEILLKTRRGITELTALDECSFSVPNDPAVVQIPSGIDYLVYARALGKPAKRDSTAPKVIFHPKLVNACDELVSADLNANGVIDVGDVELAYPTLDPPGDIVDDGVLNQDDVAVYLDLYYADPANVECLILMGSATFDAVGPDGIPLERTTGKVKATDITPLFQATFFACYASADKDGDGDVDLADVILSYTNPITLVAGDLDGDFDADADDLALYLANPLNCTQYTNASVFTIADMITYGWDTANWGTTLLNVRFYDPATTTFKKK